MLRHDSLRVGLVALTLTVASSAFAQAPAPAPAPAPAQPPRPAPAPPPATDTVQVTPPPAPGEIPPPVVPPTRVEPPVPLEPQPPPPPTPPAPEQARTADRAPEVVPEPEPQPGDGVAGWYPGFAIKSRDGNFKLRIGLNAAYRFEPYWIDGESQNRKTFFVLRPFIEGHVFKDWIRFWTSFEFASNPPFLLDSYVELQPEQEFALRIGQQWTPISRHEYFGPQQILFPEWSPVAEYFWTGRDKGVTVFGTLGEAVLDYWAGVYSGTPLRQYTAIDGNFVLEGRVTLSPMGAVADNEFLYITSKDPVPFRPSFTLQGYYGNVETATENFNQSSFRFDVEGSGQRRRQGAGAADIWLQGGPVAALVEAYVRRTDPTGSIGSWISTGVWGQVGLMVVDRTLDLGFRANYLDASDELEEDLFYSFEGQVGYYPVHTQNLQLKLRYGYAKQENPNVEGAPLFTVPGNHNLVTVQLMLAL